MYLAKSIDNSCVVGFTASQTGTVLWVNPESNTSHKVNDAHTDWVYRADKNYWNEISQDELNELIKNTKVDFTVFAKKVIDANSKEELKEMYSSQDWFVITDILRDENRTNGLAKRLEDTAMILDFNNREEQELLKVNEVLKDNQIGYWN